MSRTQINRARIQERCKHIVSRADLTRARTRARISNAMYPASASRFFGLFHQFEMGDDVIVADSSGNEPNLVALLDRVQQLSV